MTHFARFGPKATRPAHDTPAPDRLISGNPLFTTRTLENRDGLIYATCGAIETTRNDHVVKV